MKISEILRPKKVLKGVTLVELLITVVIIAILSVSAGITISSRLASNRLESAASQIVSDLTAARSAAMLKGCMTRFIFCNDKACDDKTVGAAGTFVGNTVSTKPAGYYAVLRKAQYTSSSNSCYLGSSAPADGLDQWDYDRRPQAIPTDVVFSSAPYSTSTGMYTANSGDWSVTTDSQASNSIYFTSPYGTVSGLSPGTRANGDKILFQVNSKDCSPATQDCPAFQITVSSTGEFSMQKCSSGGRSATSDTCY